MYRFDSGPGHGEGKGKRKGAIPNSFPFLSAEALAQVGLFPHSFTFRFCFLPSPLSLSVSLSGNRSYISIHYWYTAVVFLASFAIENEYDLEQEHAYIRCCDAIVARLCAKVYSYQRESGSASALEGRCKRDSFLCCW
jgi:hypothetical protein